MHVMGKSMKEILMKKEMVLKVGWSLVRSTLTLAFKGKGSRKYVLLKEATKNHHHVLKCQLQQHQKVFVTECHLVVISW